MLREAGRCALECCPPGMRPCVPAQVWKTEKTKHIKGPQNAVSWALQSREMLSRVWRGFPGDVGIGLMSDCAQLSNRGLQSSERICTTQARVTEAALSVQTSFPFP